MKWRLNHAYNGTFIRDDKGGLVASMEAGAQSKRDTDGAIAAEAPAMLDVLVPLLHWCLNAENRDTGAEVPSELTIAARSTIRKATRKEI